MNERGFNVKSKKKYIFTAFLIFILLSSSALCFYSLRNYKSTANNSSINIAQDNKAQQTPGNSMRPGFNNTQPTNNGAASGGQKNGNQGSNQLKQNSSINQLNKNPGTSQQKQNPGQRQNNFMRSANGSGSKFSPFLVAYSIIFFCLFAFFFYYFIYKKENFPIDNIKLFMIVLFICGALLRISAALYFEGYSGDISLFKSWAQSAAKNLTQFYSNSKSSDYPPLYIYILCITGKLANIQFLSKYYILLLKLPSIIADIASAYIIYRLAIKHASLKASILLSAFYLFNPAVFINSTFWGQVDSFFTLLVMLGIVFLTDRKTILSAVFFALAVLMKPQGIIYLPVLFFEMVRQKNVKTFIKMALAALIAAAVVILPFSLNNGVLWIFKLYTSTVSEYPYASMNAFNFYSLIGANLKNYTNTLFIFNYHTYGMLFIVLITLFSWFLYIKGKSSLYAAAAALVQISGVFTFSVGMHERYLFPAVALSILAFIYIKDIRFLITSIGFSITSYINTHAVLFEALNGNTNFSSTSLCLIFTSLLNVILFCYLVKMLIDIAARNKKIQLD
jgi:Gpi18-like mannosyltransferase